MKKEQTQIDQNSEVFIFKGNRPRASLNGKGKKALSFSLEGEALGVLNDISNRSGFEAFAVIVSAVSVLFSKYEQRRIIHLHSPQLKTLQKDGANDRCIPLVIKVEPEFTVQELIKETGRSLVQGYKYSNEGHREGLLNGDTNVIITYDEIHCTYNKESRYDVQIKVRKGANGTCHFDIVYSPELYDDWFIERAYSHISRILSGFQYSITKVNHIEILSENERGEILRNFNDTSFNFNSDKTLIDIITHQANENGDAVAVICSDKKLTYRELLNRADILANYLCNTCKVSDGEFVGIILDRSEWYIVAILGILKAGNAYVPIDTSYPTDRIKYILGAAHIKTVVLQSDYLSKIEEHSCHAVALDVQFELIAQKEYIPSSRCSKVTDNAYLIFTSGSTGNPKGVSITQRSLLNTQLWRKKYYGFDETFTTLQIASFSFDSSVNDIFSMLLWGGKVVILSENERLNAGIIKEIIVKHSVTNFNIVPGWYEALIKDFDHSFDSLRVITLAGEKLRAPLVQEHFAKFPEVKIVNEYGPTENAICSSALTIETPLHLDPSIGRPISNTRIYILDNNLNLLPKGVEGEICLSGVGLASGYLDPLLTESKFIKNPFDSDLKLYLTGDLGRWNQDGEIEYIGRKDQQVKINGNRIELEEIDALLLKHEAVENAIVIASEGKYIIAYILLKMEVADSDIREYLEAKLPVFMLPAYIYYVNELPLTSNGKIDRKQLLKYHHDQINKPGILAPTTIREKQLLELWQEVLEKNNISISDNFFKQGGDSLKAIQLVSRINKKFNQRNDISLVFNHPTLEAQASLISLDSSSADLSITPLPKQEYYEVSYAQKRMWVLNEISPDKAMYNLPGAYLIEGSFTENIWKIVFNELVKRHEALRTVFVKVDGNIKQRVLDFDPNFSYSVFVDLRHSPDNYVIARQIAVQENSQFDLENGPLVRAKLLQIENDKYVLLLTMHHIISDAWSMDVLIEDLVKLYNKALNNESLELPSLKFQYRDYVMFKSSQLSTENLAIKRQYWTEKFKGNIEPLQLPTDYSRPIVKSSEGAQLDFVIDGELFNSLKAFNAKEGNTLFSTLLATVKILLHKYSGQQDIIIGSPVAGRTHLALEDQVGLYMNTVPLRTSIQKHDNFEEVVERVKLTVFEALEHQDYPFDMLIEDLAIRRYSNRLPLFDVWVVLQNNVTTKASIEKLKGVEIKRFDTEKTVSRYDLKFTFEQEASQVKVVLDYSTDLFAKETIQEMMRAYQALVQNLLAAPSERINSIRMEQNNTKLENNERMHKRVRQPIIADLQKLVTRKFLPNRDGKVPVTIEANVNDLNLERWLADNINSVKEDLQKFGAVLFRNFDVSNIHDFEQTVKVFNSNLLNYDFASTPRSEVKDHIYTSTEYPEDQEIAMHNEMSYSKKWPGKLWFYCQKASASGGETPLVDSREIYQLIDEKIRLEFESNKLLYVRNYHENIDLSWQKAFQTNDRSVVEEYCQQNHIDFEWISNNHLQTRELCDAVIAHPVTKEKVWFNQAHLFHISSLGSGVRDTLQSLYGEDYMPRNVFYGNGKKIDEAILDQVRQLYQLNKILFSWKNKDVLLVDNILVGHGRQPFKGERKILVAMTN